MCQYMLQYTIPCGFNKNIQKQYNIPLCNGDVHLNFDECYVR